MKRDGKSVRVLVVMAVAGVLLAGTAFAVISSADQGACKQDSVPTLQEGAKGGKYMGAETCKNCHKSKDLGEAYQKWQSTKHSKAYETLAGDEAKKIAKEKGIADPQKDAKCVKCHVTAYGADAANLGPKFDAKQGVQCESCHGSGEKHVKARMAAEEDEGVKPGEIERPTEKTCRGCHNEESPKYKEFKFEERKKSIEHPLPKKKK